MGHQPLVIGAALGAVLLFACSRTHPAEMLSAIRSVTPHAPATGMDLAAPRLLASGSDAPTAASATAPVAAPLPGSATVAAASRRTAADCPPITPAIIAAGRRIFAGPGNCYACHGADAGGTAMAPTLHAHKWLNIDGSYASIVGLVQRGVPKPKAHPEVMPPMGGANLSATQVCDVAADVYSLSQPTTAARAAAHVAPSPAPGPPAHAAPKTVARPGPKQIAPVSVSPPAPVRPAPKQIAPVSVSPPTPVRPAPASPAASASDSSTVSMRSGKMLITFSGTPEHYTIRVENPDGRTSSTYGYSAAAAPAQAGQSTARPAEAAVAAAAAAAPAPAAPAPGAAATAAIPAAPTAAEAPGCLPMAPPTIAEGRKIFSGTGNCYACHGDKAKGTPMAPPLGAHAWLNIDGSYASIVELVTSGVPTPKAHPAPMPPKGGAQLSGQQVCAVAAYVYSLSH